MSRYSQEIHDILRNADSKRVTDKKKCVLKLLELYDNEDAINEINENSQQDTSGQVNWTFIMHSVHKILLSEADRVAAKGESSRFSADRRNTCALVLTTVRNANGSGVIFLKCSDLTSLLLQVLSSKLYANYHDTYMTVLVRHVLPVRQYWADMLSGHWKELLRVCVASYEDPSPNVKKVVVLDAIRELIQHGCLQSHLILDAKKILPFLVRVFADINQETLAKSIYKVTNSLCQQIGTESRIALCEFSEAILPNVIGLSACREKYDLLLLMVQIHHPKGACMGHGAAYACDWNKWKMILGSIHSTILSNCKAEVLSDSLVELASEVFRQVITVDDDLSPVNLISSYKPPAYLLPPKRRRVSIGGGSVDAASVVSDPESAWPVIQILTATIRKYPDSLKQGDFVPFLRIVTEFFTSTCTEEKVMDSVCRLGKVLVEIQGSYPDDFVKDEDTTRMYWDKIWDVTLRFLGMRHNEESGHQLLRSLVRHGRASNPSALVRLYVTKAIGWSASSLRTLIAFYEHTALPDYIHGVPNDSNAYSLTTNRAEPVQISLLRWALDVPKMSAQIPIEDLCKLLIGLTLKSRCKGGDRNASNSIESASSAVRYDEFAPQPETFRDTNAVNLRNVERCHLSIKFESELFDETADAKNDERVQASASHAEDALEFLIGSLREFVVQDTGSASENIDVLIMRTVLVAKVTSSMQELSMIRGNVRDFCLVSVIKESLSKVCALLGSNDALTSRYKCTYLANITKALRKLYDISYDDEIARVIVSSSTVDALKSILSLTDSGPYKKSRRMVDNYLDRSSQPNVASAVRMEALRALTSFCRKTYGTVVVFNVQRNLSRNLLKSDRYELADTTDFEMAMTLLESWGRCKSQLAHETIGIRVQLLMDLCRLWYKDELAARRILNVLPRYLGQVACAGNDVHRYNLTQILTVLHKLICDGNYGPLVSVEFVKCLGKVARLNPSLTWIKPRQNANSDENEASPIVEELLTFVNNPFYVVRLEAVRCLHVIFSSNLVGFQWLSSFFSKLKQAATNLFVVDGDLKGRERTDERATRVATALHAFATVICSNGTFQAPALFALLRLSVDKEMDAEIVRKVLRVIGATKRTNDAYRLVEDNINYLLTHWHDSRYPLHEFPWGLTRCRSLDEFYRSNICTLVPIKCRRRELADAMALCDELGLSFGGTIESCFPSIVSWLLAHVCADPPLSTIEPPATGDTREFAVEIYERLKLNQGEFRSVRKMSDLLADQLEQVIVCLVHRLHDEEHFGRLFASTVSLPASDPPHFTSETVDRCLERLTEDLPPSTSAGKSLVHYLASERRDVLQAVLSKLTRDIYQSTFVQCKLKAFHHYAYFSTAVIRELQRDHFDAMSTYVIREIGHTLLHLIKENDGEPISEMGCRCLVLLLKGALPARHEQVKEILSFAVAVLTPIVRAKQRTTTVVAAELLEHLIVDQREILGEAIGKLDPFPNDAAFDKMREARRSLGKELRVAHGLDAEIERFLNGSSCRGSVEGLSCLRHQLSTRKPELKGMYDRLETLRGFAEDCVTSTLHRLIHRLVKLMASAEPAVSLEAAKCLGEIGPADLTTMILQPATSHPKESTDPMETLMYKVTTLLSDCLIESDVALREASADALYAILADSTWGRKFSDDDYSKRFASALGDDAGSAPLRLDYVRPFLETRRADRNRRTGIDRAAKFEGRLDPNDVVWTAESCVSHVDWLTNVTCSVVGCFSNSCLRSLVPICKLSARFCESILPRLVQLTMNVNDGPLTDDVCRWINRFFDCHFRFVKETKKSVALVAPSESRGVTCLNRESVSCMLNVVNFIRLQSDNNVRPALNYLHVAKAAQYCSAYFTSILYAELWCEAPLKESRNVEALSAIDYICEHQPDDGKSLQDILREACAKIGDPDAIYGCGSSRLQDRSSRVQHYVHLRKWDKVMLAEDVELCSGNGSSTRDLLNALQQSGLQCLLGRFVRTTTTTTTTTNEKVESVDDFRYESAWRLADWDLPTTDSQRGDCASGDDYHFHHYQALKCLRETDGVGLKVALENARASIVGGLCNASLESSKTVYPWLSRLQMLREIEELSSIAPDGYGEAIDSWQRQDFASTNDFRYVEPILSQRAVMCQMRDSSLGRSSVVEDTFVGVYLNIAEVAEKQGYFQVAARALGTLAKQNNLSRETRNRLHYREALLAWKTDDQDIARVLMRGLISRNASSASLRARALRVYGNWMAETKSENPQAVIDKYYQRSIRTSMAIGQPTSRDTKNLHDAHASLAQFADVQYQRIAIYTKSPQFESMKECAEYSREAAIKLNSSVKDGDMRRAAVLNQRQSRNDVAELENIEREKNMYLLLALRHYLITLRQSEDHDLLIFRLVSLWLDNMHHRESNELLEDELCKIASFKFIPLVPQLAPHMSDVFDVFSTKISKLLEICAKEHPHHTLPVLLALMNMYEDYKFYSDKKVSARKPQPRVLGAKRLIAQLLNTEIGPIVREMMELAHSLIMLANLELETKGGRGVHSIPKSQQILRIKDLKSTLVPTLTINVKPSGKYDRIVGVYKYKETFEAVGGLNAPKKISCIGTDGICRNQLVKGKDDLRQDAVMQQVFTVMNSLLGTSKETKKRKLNIRTYKVVPLTQRSGILQWCDNTSPIINILAGSDQVSGVHKRYYPEDYTAQFCKRKLISVAAKSNDVKLQTFMDCCEHLHPAFHHFFTENYPSPETWFERRLAYIRSVATTSIIGYILGLGDRHLLNILLDVTTAEVIHIDFGIAFEQGKVLPTPETVPFRLTRDIEVAMGVSGVEGVMRRCCEETMTVLRHQREIIITLLQVLLYDPLFSWAITPAKAHSLQGGDTQARSSETSQATHETNKLAERALLRIEQKLQGTEDGLASSVAGQVERLIQQARDPANLCRLYYGWQPYL